MSHLSPVHDAVIMTEERIFEALKNAQNAEDLCRLAGTDINTIAGTVSRRLKDILRDLFPLTESGSIDPAGLANEIQNLQVNPELADDLSRHIAAKELLPDVSSFLERRIAETGSNTVSPKMRNTIAANTPPAENHEPPSSKTTIERAAGHADTPSSQAIATAHSPVPRAVPTLTDAIPLDPTTVRTTPPSGATPRPPVGITVREGLLRQLTMDTNRHTLLPRANTSLSETAAKPNYFAPNPNAPLQIEYTPATEPRQIQQPIHVASTVAESRAAGAGQLIETTVPVNTTKESWLSRASRTVKANPGRTTAVALAAAGIGYVAYEALRDKSSGQQTIGK